VRAEQAAPAHVVKEVVRLNDQAETTRRLSPVMG
jgi:hypothetical protein